MIIVLILQDSYLFKEMDKMAKSELVYHLGRKTKGLENKKVRRSVDTILEFISTAMTQQQRVEIHGFGSFHAKYHAPRRSCNPKTGEVFQSAEKRVVRFRPAKDLRERVNIDRKNVPILE